VHQHAAGARGGNSKIHLAVDANGMPVRIIITDGDSTQAESLITGIDAGYLLADKGYDSDEIVKRTWDDCSYSTKKKTEKSKRIRQKSL
jgi:IS5 family transposase